MTWKPGSGRQQASRNMKTSCPKCGAAAEQIKEKKLSAGQSELAFKCSSASCQHGFTGVLTLNRSGLPGTHNFSESA